MSYGKSGVRVARAGADASEQAAVDDLTWLRRAKVTVPDRVAGHLERAELEARANPTNQRLTLLRASGGFGKTTLLAESCRNLVQDGVCVAWISLDEQDEPQVLDTYLAFAFEHAGMDIVSSLRSVELDPGDTHRHRTDLLLRAIESHRSPCVLALDELERLSNPDSVALLNFLLRWGPANLHLAMACRELPSGLDVADLVLDGSAIVLSAEELRFSKAEIARFFGLKLSRREHRALATESAGWPIALRIRRNELRIGRTDDGVSGEAGVVREVVENWIEARCGTAWEAMIGTSCSISDCANGWMRNCSTRSWNPLMRCAGSKRCRSW